MRKSRWGALGVLVVIGSLTACQDYLTADPRTTEDPNRPTVASSGQMFVAMQIRQFTLQEGHLARVLTMWMQQFAGTDRQYLALDRYEQTEGDFSPQFSAVYTGGGLIDQRELQQRLEAANNRTFAGVVKVWEAFNIGTAASIWGAIPYSEAVNPEIAKPRLDTQSEVYAQVQAVLDEAVADLQSGQGAGPGALDLVYGGDTQKWTEAAHTLKARYHLHWAGVDPARYAQAYAAAQQGISTAANDFRTFHSNVPGEENIWYQFMFRERDSYIRAGKFMVDLLGQREDPRRQQYFAQGKFRIPDTERDIDSIFGAPPATALTAASVLEQSTRGNPAFRQPLITYAENQLIMAEAAFHGAGGGQAQALIHLNNARAAAGRNAITVAVGDALLREIMTEKYIALFQNIEVWNDYKRTCLPAINPVTGKRIPGRLLYGVAERNVNPNIPAPQQQQQRNENDPGRCTAESIVNQ